MGIKQYPFSVREIRQKLKSFIAESPALEMAYDLDLTQDTMLCERGIRDMSWLSDDTVLVFSTETVRHMLDEMSDVVGEARHFQENAIHTITFGELQSELRQQAQIFAYAQSSEHVWESRYAYATGMVDVILDQYRGTIPDDKELLFPRNIADGVQGRYNWPVVSDQLEKVLKSHLEQSRRQTQDYIQNILEKKGSVPFSKRRPKP